MLRDHSATAADWRSFRTAGPRENPSGPQDFCPACGVGRPGPIDAEAGV